MARIDVFSGGNVLYGQFGVCYNRGPICSFDVTIDVSFDEVRRRIYERFHMSSRTHNLWIRMKYSENPYPNIYFNEQQVSDNGSWSCAFNSMLGSGWRTLELFVDAFPINASIGNEKDDQFGRDSRNEAPDREDYNEPSAGWDAWTGPTSSHHYNEPSAGWDALTGPTSSHNYNEPSAGWDAWPGPSSSNTYYEPGPSTFYVPPTENTEPASPPEHEPEAEPEPERQSVRPSGHRYSPRSTSRRQLNPNSPREDNDDDIGYDIVIEEDDIPLHERVARMIARDQEPIGNTYEDPNIRATEGADDDGEADDEENTTFDMGGLDVLPRSIRHPVSSFNDASAIHAIVGDGRFCGPPGYCTDENFRVGSVYRSKDNLKWMVHHVHIKLNRMFTVVNSSKKRYSVKCDKNCGWKLHATVRNDGKSFVIKKQEKSHECVMLDDRSVHPLLNSPFVASLIIRHVRENVRFTMKDISSVVQSQYNFRVPYLTRWRAKEAAIARIFGGWTESYTRMARLLDAIEASNPESKVEWWTVPSDVPGQVFFQGVCWAFGASIGAFQHCRPIIGIDGTYLSGRWGGKLLTACGYDADNQLLSLAFALCDEERDVSWQGFMKFVRDVVGDRKVAVISDRHASIMKVFSSDVNCGWDPAHGKSVHRLCARHIILNFKNKFKNDRLKTMAEGVMYQTQLRKFNRKLDELRNLNPGAAAYLEKVGRVSNTDPLRYDLWAHAHDATRDSRGDRWGIMTTNGPESLNNVFKEARELPVTAIVEVTYYKSVKYFAERRYKAYRYITAGHEWSPKVQKTLDDRRSKGNGHRVIVHHHNRRYEIHTPEHYERNTQKDGNVHTVRLDHPDVNQCDCTCQKAQLEKIPCSNVLAVCGARSLESNKFVSKYYSTEYLLNTWSYEFGVYGNPDDSPHDGPTMVPDPLLYTVKSGRRERGLVTERRERERRKRVGRERETERGRGC